MEISNDLDVAIWQLDSAEAVLDGKPKPPRPEAKRLDPLPRQTDQDRVTVPAPRPDYQRRPSRRSSYLGPGMLEMLIGVAGQVLAGSGRGRKPRGGGLGSMFGRSPTRKPSPPPQSGSSGGGVVPGWASVIALISFFFGILFLFLALLAEYIGRILVEVRGRPRYIVSEVI